ncbi:hypothetical protein L0Y49_01335, partial [bacterium]|nr:hypothetical protein [bacterium]
LKISTIFFAFLAAFSPRTMNSRYVNSFFTSSRKNSKTLENQGGFGVLYAYTGSLLAFFENTFNILTYHEIHIGHKKTHARGVR